MLTLCYRRRSELRCVCESERLHGGVVRVPDDLVRFCNVSVNVAERRAETWETLPFAVEERKMVESASRTTPKRRELFQKWIHERGNLLKELTRLKIGFKIRRESSKEGRHFIYHVSSNLQVSLDEKGKLYSSWFGKTIINSNRRYNYEEVQAMIEGADGDFKQELLVLNGLATITDWSRQHGR